MIGTLAWKEYREQRMVWASLGALTFLLIWGLAQLIAPGDMSSGQEGAWKVGVLAALAMAGTYGLICGALMLGGERESGAQAFLDRLSSWRIKLWAAKLVFGSGLALTQALLIAALVTALGYGTALGSLADLFAALAGVALEALAWGMLGAALCRSVLAAAGLSALLLALSWVGCGPVSWPLQDSVLLRRIGLALAALCGSAFLYCRSDLLRLPSAERSLRKISHGSYLPRSWWVLLWLCWRQGFGAIRWLAIAALGAGILLPSAGLVIWPVTTLLIGVVCGFGVFAGEQAGGSYRFLADRRLPAGRVWAIKVVFWLAVSVAMAAVVLVGIWARITINDAFAVKVSDGRPGMTLLDRALNYSEVLRTMGHFTFLIVWLVHGFCVGQFVAMAVRKTVVAALPAVLLSSVTALLWVPSLLCGGLNVWQVFVVPMLLLLATRLLMWAWMNNRLYSGTALVYLSVSVVAAAGWIGGSLWHRAQEIPDVGEPFDVSDFVAGLPSPEQNRAGRLIQEAIAGFRRQEKAVLEKLERRRSSGNKQREAIHPSHFYLIQVEVEIGWTDRDGELGRWLDQMFAGDWARHLREASELPLGLVVDPRQVTVDSPLEATQRCREMGLVFEARAMQLQSRGEHAAALDHFGVVLSLSRNLRNRAVSMSWSVGRGLERSVLRGIDRWVTKVGPQPALLKRALDMLTKHEHQGPPDADSIKAEYLLVLNSFSEASLLDSWGERRTGDWTAKLDHELVVRSLQAPWERKRALRIVNAIFAHELELAARRPRQARAATEEDDSLFHGIPRHRLLGYSTWSFAQLSSGSVYMEQCRLRAARLKLALALYQIREGKPAKKLADLVPRYLAKIPTDVFTGKPFHYSISNGERLERRFGDRGIIWCVLPYWPSHQGDERVERGQDGYHLLFFVPDWGAP